MSRAKLLQDQHDTQPDLDLHTPLGRLRHTLANYEDMPDGAIAIMATHNVFGPDVTTGITWGDLRKIAKELAW